MLALSSNRCHHGGMEARPPRDVVGTARATAEGIRARNRREFTAAIKASAERQLAAEGASSLSLRRIARELRMASSAIYRYFASRDELLTALVIDAYNDLGAAAEVAFGAEAALDAESAQAAPGQTIGASRRQWLAVCRVVREWALRHPHRYGLIYGTPVPGYRAPADTIAPASRVGLVLANIVAAAQRRGEISTSTREVPAGLADDALRLAESLELELPAGVIVAMVAAWSQLFGLVSFELFGQFENMVTSRDEFFDLAALALADSVGLVPG